MTDSGVGIPDQEKSRVFERFYSGKWGGDYVGTGIGLNLTKLLVELHEGVLGGKQSRRPGYAFHRADASGVGVAGGYFG